MLGVVVSEWDVIKFIFVCYSKKKKFVSLLNKIKIVKILELRSPTSVMLDSGHGLIPIPESELSIADLHDLILVSKRADPLTMNISDHMASKLECDSELS